MQDRAARPEIALESRGDARPPVDPDAGTPPTRIPIETIPGGCALATDQGRILDRNHDFTVLVRPPDADPHAPLPDFSPEWLAARVDRPGFEPILFRHTVLRRRVLGMVRLLSPGRYLVFCKPATTLVTPGARTDLSGLTHRHSAADESAPLIDLLRSIFDGIDAGLSFIGPDLRVWLSNRYLLETFEGPIHPPSAPGGSTDSEEGGLRCYEQFSQSAPCTVCPGTESLDTGRWATKEERRVCRDGEIRDFWIKTYPVRDQDDRILGFIEYFQDITAVRASEKFARDSAERLEALVLERTRELEQSRLEVIQQEKMAAFGLLAAGIAHEVGNPLTAISFMIQLLKRTMRDPKLQDQLTTMLQHVDRIAKIVRELADFSRPPKLGARLASVNEPLEVALRIARYDPRAKRVEIRPELAVDLPRLPLVEDQLVSVFFNIIVNALDVLESGGALEVTSFAKEGHVHVVFEDDGPGVPDDLREKIFHPFFTTKPVGKGTGLGLSVSYGIVRKMGGTIAISRGALGGARFEISLPEVKA